MKINIDTKEDSKEEIKKIIKFLSTLVDEPVYSNEPLNQENQEGLFALFNQPQKAHGKAGNKKEKINEKIKLIEY